MTSAYRRARDMLSRCLLSRLPRELNREIAEFLARPRGRPRKAYVETILQLRIDGLTEVEIAARLGCDPSAVRRVK